MEIIVHNHFTLKSTADIFQSYLTPVWEIEVKSSVLDSPEFESELRNGNNFTISKGHHNDLRSIYNGSGVVSKFLEESCQDFLLNLINQSPCFNNRFVRPVDEYRTKSSWFATVLKDQPEFKMSPHIDNVGVMAQMVVNLLQDNETSTEFYQFNESTPCYRAPLKKNHGVVFLNTPGAIHRITNVNKTRWILYGGLLI